MSVKTYLTGLTFLILMFCLYVISKTLELRKLRKKLFLQKAELDQIVSTLEEVTAFYQISSVIITKQSLITILKNIAQESLKCLKADRSSIYRIDGEKGYLMRQMTYASNPLNEKVNLSEEKEVARKAILQNRPFLLGKPEDFVNFFKYAEREEKINSLMSLPILAEGKPVGALSVARINKEYSFTEDDIKRLSIFRNYASIAIENSNLLEELNKKIKYRKNYDKYCGNILELLEDLTEEERKEIEEYGKNLWRKRREQGEKKITLLSELTAEQRQHERIDEILEVEFENDILAQTENISEGGVFIRTQNPLELEEEFVLKLYIPDEQEPVNVLCKVVWANKYGKESEDLPRGMGVKFLRLKAEDRIRIEEFVKIQKNKNLLPEKELLPSS
jgi:type IV pilus assembly protein PilZ